MRQVDSEQRGNLANGGGEESIQALERMLRLQDMNPLEKFEFYELPLLKEQQCKTSIQQNP